MDGDSAHRLLKKIVAVFAIVASLAVGGSVALGEDMDAGNAQERLNPNMAKLREIEKKLLVNPLKTAPYRTGRFNTNKYDFYYSVCIVPELNLHNIPPAFFDNVVFFSYYGVAILGGKSIPALIEDREREKRLQEEAQQWKEAQQSDSIAAATMLEQAEQYRRMGTRVALKSAQFLYKEIIRRHPNTSQAKEVQEKLADLVIPDQKPERKSPKGNPFIWNNDPEPPWIAPQPNSEIQSSNNSE